MEGAWALVLIYDREHKHETKPESADFITPMALVSKENMEHSAALLDATRWHLIDFKKFTLTHTNAGSYDFSVQTVQKQLVPK